MQLPLTRAIDSKIIVALGAEMGGVEGGGGSGVGGGVGC